MLDAAGADALLLYNAEYTPDFGFHYLTGAPLNTLTGSFLLADRHGAELLASVLDFGSAKKIPGVKARMFGSKKQLEGILRKKLKGKKAGLNCPALSCRALSRIKKLAGAKKFIDVSKQLETAREIKTGAEISKLREACRITEGAIEKACSRAKAGMSELEIARMIEIEALRDGAQGLSFPAIVASGRNSSVPHHITSRKKISRGELLLVDIGARFENYTSDISRMFAVGKPGEAQKAAYDAVYSTLKTCTGMAKEGTKAKNLYITADSMLKKLTPKGLIHSLGHGIGLQDHDFPGGINKGSKWKLRSGMALAIEPAVYLRRFGVRIEDNLVVQKHGCRMLSKAPGELVRI